MPLMNWFRGLSADVARINDELFLNAQLDMVHIEVGPPEDPEAGGGGLETPQPRQPLQRLRGEKRRSGETGLGERGNA